jgi:hypothetical protein
MWDNIFTKRRMHFAYRTCMKFHNVLHLLLNKCKLNSISRRENVKIKAEFFPLLNCKVVAGEE